VKHVATAALLALCLSAPASGAGVEELVAQCEDCHGAGGVSTHAGRPDHRRPERRVHREDPAHLPGLGPALHQDGLPAGRHQPAENRHVPDRRGTDREDVRALAAHFSALPFKPAPQEFDADLAAAGAALHEAHCETCHASGGQVADRGPRLAGQWVPYLRTSIKFVPTGEHLVPPAMESAVNDLAPQDIDALMHYYASQQE
jgi:cytochrome subunit of sulfide dehydrogenase